MRSSRLFKNLMRGPVTEAAPEPGDQALAELAGKVDRAAKARLGRSLAIREVDAGSCNACELEIHALNNAFYDLEQFGLRFVASPRHADVLLVTGPVTKNMREALERTYAATPGPEMGGGGRQLRRRWRHIRRQLRRDRRGRQGGAGRSAHQRLPAHADRPVEGPAGTARTGAPEIDIQPRPKMEEARRLGRAPGSIERRIRGQAAQATPSCTSSSQTSPCGRLPRNYIGPSC